MPTLHEKAAAFAEHHRDPAIIVLPTRHAERPA